MAAFAPVLVIGGQKSGKSQYAEGLVAASGLSPVYLALATAGDAEMEERIRAHRARRGSAWSLLEEPLDLAGALAGAAGPGRMVLAECLTLWLSNLMECGRDVDAECDRLLAVLHDIGGPVVLVSNEVGSGIVPDNALARRFADRLGVVNQRVAAIAGEVVLIAAGLPLVLKSAAAETVR